MAFSSPAQQRKNNVTSSLQAPCLPTSCGRMMSSRLTPCPSPPLARCCSLPFVILVDGRGCFGLSPLALRMIGYCDPVNNNEVCGESPLSEGWLGVQYATLTRSRSRKKWSCCALFLGHQRVCGHIHWHTTQQGRCTAFSQRGGCDIWQCLRRVALLPRSLLACMYVSCRSWFDAHAALRRCLLPGPFSVGQA